MDPSLVSLVLLVIGLGMGTLLSCACYAWDLRRLTTFLRKREPQGNARATAGTAPGVTALADAINGELDRSAQAHVEALRHQREFQRDLSALSHDIRTPLTGAKGYLQLASGEDDPAARARHLEAAARRIDATCELLDQLFAYAKSADPDLELELEPLTLRPLVEEALIGQYPAFEGRSWEPEVSFDDDAPMVEADREALARILDNLVVNAPAPRDVSPGDHRASHGQSRHADRVKRRGRSHDDRRGPPVRAVLPGGRVARHGRQRPGPVGGGQPRPRHGHGIDAHLEGNMLSVTLDMGPRRLLTEPRRHPAAATPTSRRRCFATDTSRPSAAA